MSTTDVARANGWEQAFPTPKVMAEHYEDCVPAEYGLTKREYFAGLAMQGILANSFMAKDGADDGDRLVLNWADCADNAIGYADALLDALAKGRTEATTEEAE